MKKLLLRLLGLGGLVAYALYVRRTRRLGQPEPAPVSPLA